MHLAARASRVRQLLPSFASPQTLEKLQSLYLANNLLDSVPGPLPLSLRSLHLQVSGSPTARA